VIDDGKRRFYNLQSYLYQLWREMTDAISSSHHVANQEKLINQLTPVKEFAVPVTISTSISYRSGSHGLLPLTHEWPRKRGPF
jgi:hypothetical protein